MGTRRTDADLVEVEETRSHTEDSIVRQTVLSAALFVGHGLPGLVANQPAFAIRASQARAHRDSPAAVDRD